MLVTADGESFTIKDYAYESTAGGGILAGQTVNSVTDQVADGVSFQVINNTVQLDLLNTHFTNGNVAVVSTTGQTVHTSSLTGSRTIDLNGYASGVYMISVTFDQGQVNHKLFVR